MGKLSNDNLIQIDGRMGEGGGQVLRSSLALSMLTGIPFRLDNIRGNRRKPGLKRQHLTCVKAAKEISNGSTQGASLNSSRLDFHPGQIKAGSYQFSIGTAGSTTLVLQSILPALILADEPSEIIIEGGTHNDMAPPFDYISKVFLPVLKRMGPVVNANLLRYGFYPAGGGCIEIHIEPVEKLTPLTLTDKGKIAKHILHALSSQIPGNVTERELKKARQLLKIQQLVEEDIPCKSIGPGNALMIECQCEHITELFTSIGSVKQSAERVAKNAVRAYQQWIVSDAPVSEHLADQLAIPCALACTSKWGSKPEQPSIFHAATLDMHAYTQFDLLPMFLPVSFTVEEKFDERRQTKFQKVMTHNKAI